MRHQKSIQPPVALWHAQPAASPASAGFQPSAAALAVAGALSLGPFANSTAQAQALPTGAQAIHGSAGLQQVGSTLHVNTANGAGTGHSAINWQSFSIGQGAAVQFNQPSAASTSINRVISNVPSQLLGNLSSNGKLVLVNPAGIAAGAGSSINTAGFTASVLSLSEADAKAGLLRFGGDSAQSINGSLSLQGRIVARGGDVVLIAPQIEVGSQAVIEAPDGATILAAGHKVAITGRGLEGIHLQIQAPENQAINLGQLTGNAVGLFAGSLKHSGLISATDVSVEGGKVVLKAQDSLDIDGRIAASQGGTGGKIHATANKVKLKSGAVIEATGSAGGGEVLIGGGYQGQDSRVTNAQQTTIEQGVRINADAQQNGNGGTVVIWSDGQTRTAADISAQGGTSSGNGGLVETSGKQYLDVRATPNVSARAAGARGGEWLLDPTSIIVGMPAPTPSPFPVSVVVSPTPGTQVFEGTPTFDSYVDPALIETALGAGNTVVIKTTDGGTPGTQRNESNVRFAASVQPVVTTNGGILRVVAHENITVDAGVNIRPATTGSFDIDFQAGYSYDLTGGSATPSASSTGGAIIVATGATLASGGGTIQLRARNPNGAFAQAINLNSATLDAGTGSLFITGLGNATTGGVQTSGSTRLSGAGVTVLGTSGTVTGIRQEGVILGTGTTLAAGAGGLLIRGAATEVEAASSPVTILGADLDTTGSLVIAAGANYLASGAFHALGITDNNARLNATGGISLFGDVQNGTLTPTASGVLIQGAQITTGGDLTISGSLSSTNAGTALAGTTLNGLVSAAGNIVIGGAISAPAATASTGLSLTGGGIVTTGAASAISLTGSGVLAGAPASDYDINLQGTTVSSGGGEITLIGDRVNLASSINSGTGRTSIRPSTLLRSITLGGAAETSALNLTAAELNFLTASVIVLGSGSHNGGIGIGNTGGMVTIDPQRASSLSLINSSTASINQAAPFSVSRLNADAGTVFLANTGNQVDAVSGRASNATGTGFRLSVSSPTGLTVDTVDGVAGIQAITSNPTGGITLTNSAGPVNQVAAANLVTDQAVTVNAAGGVTLQGGNSVARYTIVNDGGNILLANSGDTRLNLTNNATGPAAGRIEYSGIGSVTIDGITSLNTTDNLATAAGASVSIRSTASNISGGIFGTAALGADITTGGAVYLFTDGGNCNTIGCNIGLTGASSVGIDSPQPIAAIASTFGGIALELANANSIIESVQASGDIAIMTAPAGTPAPVRNLTFTASSASSGGGISVTGFNDITLNGAAITAAGAVNFSASNNININASETADAVLRAGTAGAATGLDIAVGAATGVLALNGNSGGYNAILQNSGTGDVNISGSQLTLAGNGVDALVLALGNIANLPAVCNGCEPLAPATLAVGMNFGSNGIAQSGIQAANYFRQINANGESAAISDSGGSVGFTSLLSNDSVTENRLGVVTESPAAGLANVQLLGELPLGITLDAANGVINFDPALAAGTYNLGYRLLSGVDLGNYSDTTLTVTKAAAGPAPVPIPPPPAPTVATTAQLQQQANDRDALSGQFVALLAKLVADQSDTTQAKPGSTQDPAGVVITGQQCRS